MRLISKIFECLAGGFTTALALDLLYLYYARAWHDPIRFIEIGEVITLWLLVLFGIYISIKNLIGIAREKR